MKVENLKVKIFADGADLKGILEMAQKPYIKGFTTNPTLMKQAGISNYEAFAKELLTKIQDRHISFEVFADDLPEMERQALKIKSWGPNVYVKIPVTNTKSEPTYELLKRLVDQGVNLNVTAVFTFDQIKAVAESMKKANKGVISVFAGRIADAGVDPVPYMKEARAMIRNINPKLELLWASPRELLNIVQADETGCDIITVSNDILKKIPNLGKDLAVFSLETVKMFYNDATSAGFKL